MLLLLRKQTCGIRNRMRVGPQLEKFQIKAKTNARLQMLAFKTRWKKIIKEKILMEIKSKFCNAFTARWKADQISGETPGTESCCLTLDICHLHLHQCL